MIRNIGHDYGLPFVDQSLFTIQRVNTKYFIIFEPKDGFWHDVAEAIADYCEWDHARKYPGEQEFYRHFRSDYGYKDKKTAKIGFREFVQSIKGRGKGYIDGNYTIEDEEELQKEKE